MRHRTLQYLAHRAHLAVEVHSKTSQCSCTQSSPQPQPYISTHTPPRSPKSPLSRTRTRSPPRTTPKHTIIDPGPAHPARPSSIYSTSSSLNPTLTQSLSNNLTSHQLSRLLRSSPSRYRYRYAVSLRGLHPEDTRGLPTCVRLVLVRMRVRVQVQVLGRQVVRDLTVLHVVDPARRERRREVVVVDARVRRVVCGTQRGQLRARVQERGERDAHSSGRRSQCAQNWRQNVGRSPCLMSSSRTRRGIECRPSCFMSLFPPTRQPRPAHKPTKTTG